MDVETSAAIERLADPVDSVEVSLREEIVAVRNDLSAELRDGLAEARQRDETLFVGLGELRTELREGLAEARRYAEILSESQRDDIRILAERFAMLSSKIDSLQR